jgi:hypothetical protein
MFLPHSAILKQLSNYLKWLYYIFNVIKMGYIISSSSCGISVLDAIFVYIVWMSVWCYYLVVICPIYV